MNRRLVMFGCLCLMICGCNESKPFNGNWGSCDADFVPVCLSESSALKCVDGQITETVCDSGITCVKGICGTDNPQTCDATDRTFCDGKTLVECKGGKETRTDCPNGCEKGECKNASQDCSNNLKNGQRVCDGDTLVECKNGSESRTQCPNGCENNECKSEISCGNNIIDGDDVCDGTELGNLTCSDLPDADAQAVYSGTPKCKSDCSGIEQGTCEATQCGNGTIQTDIGEICDFADGDAIFLNTPTCSDYKSNYNWKAGGKPGCGNDCKTLSKGSCEIEGALGSIQACQLVSLNADDSTKTVTMTGRIVVDSDVEPSNVTGRMVCILHSNSDGVYTYAWGLKEDAAPISCSDCDTGEYLFSASLDYTNWGEGVYDCAFLANAQGGNNSYYLCATDMASPVPQEIDVPSASQRLQFEIEPLAIEGVLLAKWLYSAYKKDDTATVVAADDGVFASQSTMQLSDGGTIRMLSGTTGNPEAAASMDRLPQNEEYDPNEKYFRFVTSSLGYQNIRIQFKAAGSGLYEKRITVGYKVGDLINTAGSELKFDDKNTYHAFPDSQLVGADNMPELEIRIYPYGGSGDVNATVRIDDVYVTGDKL